MGALLCCAVSAPTTEEQNAVKAVIDKALKDHRVMIFSKTFCPYCGQAKGVLSKNMGGSKFGVMEVSRNRRLSKQTWTIYVKKHSKFVVCWLQICCMLVVALVAPHRHKSTAAENTSTLQCIGRNTL